MGEISFSGLRLTSFSSATSGSDGNSAEAWAVRSSSVMLRTECGAECMLETGMDVGRESTSGVESVVIPRESAFPREFVWD